MKKLRCLKMMQNNNLVFVAMCISQIVHVLCINSDMHTDSISLKGKVSKPRMGLDAIEMTIIFVKTTIRFLIARVYCHILNAWLLFVPLYSYSYNL